MRSCVILNPAAGSGNSVSAVRSSVASLPDAELRECDGSASVGHLVRSAVADGYRRIVAAGGDGTVGAVASAVLAAGGRPLGCECGILPIGTGNDLAMALGIPLKLERAIEILRRGSARTIDMIDCSSVGRIGAEPVRSHAWNAIVGGFGGRVSEQLTPAQKRRWRRFAYLRAALSELREVSPHSVRLEIDGTSHDLELLMLVIANGSRAGGGIPLAPEARVDDGALDVVGIRAQKLSALLRIVPRLLAGDHLGAPGVFFARARSVKVESDPGLQYNRDGEAWESGGAEFELHPEALAFVRP
jgi:diacylglycerol kinase (ATP)